MKSLQSSETFLRNRTDLTNLERNLLKLFYEVGVVNDRTFQRLRPMGGETPSLKVHVFNLRRKGFDIPSRGYGRGYRLCPKQRTSLCMEVAA